MINNGIPADNIVVMMYDDVANNRSNPFPGQLFNHPDGENVYDASAIDYSGADVTPEKFLAVLKGDAKTAGGKVLSTDKNSKVFVNFADHGAPGFVCFPSANLYADDLQDTIDYMQANNLYDEMTIYIEACESGSMFPNLADDQKVLGVTASNASQSSWAAYCSPEDVVQGVEIGSCLGDLFSVNWMEDTEANNAKVETLATQFSTVQAETSLSPVMKFGDFSFMDEPVADFQGDYNGASNPKLNNLLQMTQKPVFKKAEKKAVQDSRDVKMHYLYRKLQRNGANEEDHQELIDELTHRMNEDALFEELFPHHEAENMVVEPVDFGCLRFLVDTHDEYCGRFSDYALKHVKHFVHACEVDAHTVNAVATQMASICQAIV